MIPIMATRRSRFKATRGTFTLCDVNVSQEGILIMHFPYHKYCVALKARVRMVSREGRQYEMRLVGFCPVNLILLLLETKKTRSNCCFAAIKRLSQKSK